MVSDCVTIPSTSSSEPEMSSTMFKFETEDKELPKLSTPIRTGEKEPISKRKLVMEGILKYNKY